MEIWTGNEMHFPDIQGWKPFTEKKHSKTVTCHLGKKKKYLYICIQRKRPVGCNGGNFWREEKRICVFCLPLFSNFL